MRGGVQLYKCHVCKRQFRGKDHIGPDDLWDAYSSRKQTYGELSGQTGLSVTTIWRRTKDLQFDWNAPRPREDKAVIVHMDVTYFGRNHGVFLALDEKSGLPLYVKHLKHEKVEDYVNAANALESLGYKIGGIVVDGLRGIFKAFHSYNVQMCHFHMCAIIRRKITKSPKTECGKELHAIMKQLANSSKSTFEALFHSWEAKWESYLSEKSQTDENGKWWYVHKELRSARRSIRFHLPYLFTFERVPGMPNTNNKLEGTFTDLKTDLRNHSGMTQKNRERYINDYFNKMPKKKE